MLNIDSISNTLRAKLINWKCLFLKNQRSGNKSAVLTGFQHLVERTAVYVISEPGRSSQSQTTTDSIVTNL